MNIFHLAAIMGLGGGELLLITVILALIASLRWIIVAAIAATVVKGVTAARNEPGTPLREQRKCPDCAEFILTEARVCKHCGCRFEGMK